MRSKTVRFKVVSGKIHIYDDQLNYICSHNLSERKGSVNQLPEHRKQDSGDWIEIMERLRGKWNCYDFQHFINGVKKENPRHISKQLRAIEQFLDSENPDKSLVAQVMKECCQKYRYQFSQFKVVYSLAKAGRELATDDCRAQVPSGSVSYTDLSVYAKSLSGTHREEGGCCSMNREILKSMDTGHIPVQRLTALLETFTLKHAARMLPDLLETADLQDSSCQEFLLAVLETEVKGRNERRRKRKLFRGAFPTKYPATGRVRPGRAGVRNHSGTALRLERNCPGWTTAETLSLRGLRASARLWSPVVWGCRLSTAAIRYVLRR